MTTVLADAYPTLMAPAYDPEVLSLILPAMTNANPVLLASGTYYVAEVEQDLVVACDGWTVEEPGSGKRESGVAHIRHFGSLIAWNGKGLGRTIFDRCRKDALARGVRTFRCYASLNAEPFYRALGFAVMKRLDVTMSNGGLCPTVIMSRDISELPN